MSSPERKRKRKTKTKKQNPSPVLPSTSESLPDDLLLSCFARVSRLQYPTLSLVSKSFRSILASSELYKTRSLLNVTESCLYVCLQFPPDASPHWFTLCRKPDQTLTKQTKKSTRYVLARIPIPHSPPVHEFALVAIGSNIYNIGGSVLIMDCRSHTWHEGPNMRGEQYDYPFAKVLDGKIYVTWGSKDGESWEVFDPKTQTWEFVTIPDSERHENVEIDSLLFLSEHMNRRGVKGFAWESYGMIENVLMFYSHISGDFKWYDSKVPKWKEVKGVEGLPKFDNYACVKLVDYGGKMAVFWDKYLPYSGCKKKVPSSGCKKKVIWCAVISFERRNNEKEIWGMVEWFDVVLTVPGSYEFVSALSAIV